MKVTRNSNYEWISHLLQSQLLHHYGCGLAWLSNCETTCFFQIPLFIGNPFDYDES